MYKAITKDIMAKVLIEAICLSNVEEIAQKHDISKQTIQRKFELIQILIPYIVSLTLPQIPLIIEFFRTFKSPCSCPCCGSTSVSKNGKITLVNWAKRFFKKIVPGLYDDKESIQRFICNDCKTPILSKEHIALKNIRISVKLFVNKFICLLRFKEGLSLRSVSRISCFAFDIHNSLGYLSKFTNVIGQKAEDKLKMLSLCRATKKAITAIIDETFPKIFHKSVSLGVVICEYGLIRGVGCVKKSANSIKGLMRHCIGKSFQPLFLLGDFLPAYKKVAKKLKLIRLYDFVHATRHIYKLVRTHIGKIHLTLNNHEKLSPENRKNLLKLKKKLLRKRVMPIIRTLFKGLKKQYRAVGHLYIMGALEDIERLTKQFPSLKLLYKTVNKFVKKYLDTWCFQMLIAHLVPTTSNSIESKNSIFKRFSQRIKAFSSKASLVRYFSAVALWENFNVKERGLYKGTSAMQRAGINLDDFGATNFFEAVGLENISQRQSKEIDSNKIIIYLFKQILLQPA